MRDRGIVHGFKKYAERKSPWWFWVRFYSTKEAMWKDQHLVNRELALTTSFLARDRTSRLVSVLNFALDDFDGERIGHEVSHAVDGWLKRIGKTSADLDAREFCERLAMIRGGIGGQIMNEWVRFMRNYRGCSTSPLRCRPCPMVTIAPAYSEFYLDHGLIPVIPTSPLQPLV